MTKAGTNLIKRKTSCVQATCYMEMFDIKERDKLEEFLKEITVNIDIRTQEKIFEKAENLHRLMATQEKMDSWILAFEIVTLCVKEKMFTVHLEWMKIVESKDLTINLRHIMEFGDDEFEMKILNTGEIVYNMLEFVNVAGLYV